MSRIKLSTAKEPHQFSTVLLHCFMYMENIKKQLER